ncbi:MAG TPA: transketolase C-terminal domain-containing protein, partial [Paracoccaceae bacterium]|nr:transketolase C-terminal domain-containing protein [Paracoccaceae bacterium]
TSENLSAKGAYILREADGERDLTLLATGTEVGLAVRAQAALKAEGINAAVVSMPCWELFDQQDDSYRTAVLGTAPRIGIEAAMSFGWDRWLDRSDRFIGMTGFGASAVTPVLYEHFGITVEAVVSAGKDLVQG